MRAIDKVDIVFHRYELCIRVPYELWDDFQEFIRRSNTERDGLTVRTYDGGFVHIQRPFGGPQVSLMDIIQLYKDDFAAREAATG